MEVTMKIHAIAVPADMTQPCTLVDIDDYRDIQHHVGGAFDVMDADITTWLEDRAADQGVDLDQWPHLRDGGYRSSLWCHDMGLVIGLPWNLRVNVMFSTRLAGDIVITGPTRYDGESTSVHPHLADAILKASDQQQQRLTRAVAPFN
jgi:hypothetical protein